MNIRISLLAAATVLAGTTMFAQQATTPAAGQQPAGAQQPGGRGGRGQGGIQQSPFTTPPVRIYLYAGLKTHGRR